MTLVTRNAPSADTERHLPGKCSELLDLHFTTERNRDAFSEILIPTNTGTMKWVSRKAAYDLYFIVPTRCESFYSGEQARVHGSALRSCEVMKMHPVLDAGTDRVPVCAIHRIHVRNKMAIGKKKWYRCCVSVCDRCSDSIRNLVCSCCCSWRRLAGVEISSLVG